MMFSEAWESIRMNGDASAPQQLPCPVCNQWTDSLKQYRYFNRCTFFLAGVYWQALIIRACPQCMRHLLRYQCLRNILSANLFWPIVVLPLGLVFTALTYRKGHSRAVLQGITPAKAVAQEREVEESSFRRILAIVSVLAFWMPLLGLGFMMLAYLFTRGYTHWSTIVVRYCLYASLIVHFGLVVLLVVSAIAK